MKEELTSATWHLLSRSDRFLVYNVKDDTPAPSDPEGCCRDLTH